MIRSKGSALCLLFLAALAGHASANERAPEAQQAVTDPFLTSPSESAENHESSVPASPTAWAVHEKLATLPKDGNSQEIKERAVLVDFYNARASLPLWVTPKGLTAEAVVIIDEIKKANAWGLEAKDFVLPQLAAHIEYGLDLAPVTVAEAELTLSLAILEDPVRHNASVSSVRSQLSTRNEPHKSVSVCLFPRLSLMGATYHFVTLGEAEQEAVWLARA